MKGKGIKAFGFALLGALALLFTGCGQQGGGGGGSTPTTGKVSLVVTTDDGASPQPYTATYTPAISDPSAVTPGDYEVKVQKSGYFDAYARFTVRAGETTTVTVRLQKLPAGGPNTGTVAVLVVNQTGQPIQGATVSDGTNSGTTDAQGRVNFTYNTPGAVAISVNASGYQGAAQLASVELGKVTALTYKLSPEPTPAPTTGTVVVHVYGQDTGSTLAGASVSSDPSLTFSGSNPFTATGAPGTYVITASAPGYNTGNQAVQIEAGKTVVLNLGLTKKAISGPVYNLEIVSVKDQWGVDLFGQDEKNANKIVKLYAAQTEEPVCVTVKVTDGQNPVQNARVRVSATAQYWADVIHLAPGCVSQPSAELDFVMTDAQGQAKFTIFSTGMPDPWRDGLYTPDPVKFVVSASGESWTADLKEFKVFFWNISHLYHYSEYKERGETKKIEKPTKKRTGDDLGEIISSYDFDVAQYNDHFINSFVYQKQPPTGPYSPALNSYLLPGYMEYTLTGGDTGKVQWVKTGGGVDSCEVISPDGLTCEDQNGSGVILQPRPGVTASDLPIRVEVKATLYVQVSYGEDPDTGDPLYYPFPLKDYTFKKTWTGATLKVEKSGPSVIGWSGKDLSRDDVTLAAQGADVPNGAKYTYTITVTNTSATETAQNVVITDPLPAELGFVSASNGGTYNSTFHEVTWGPTDIGPGQSVSVKVTVYARHKPGYIWNNGDQTTTDEPGESGYYYSGRPPDYDPNTNTPYPDPYRIINYATAKGENTPQVKSLDKEIYVVRPFLKLSKTPNMGTFPKGDTIRFTLTVENVDRASNPISDPDYQQLKNDYPTDYANALTAYEVKVRDLFGEGLDYVSSSPAGTLDGDGKTLTFKLGDLALDEKKEIQVFLRAREVGDSQNCARLYAYNLNQPEQVTAADGTTYTPRWNVPPDQLEPTDGNGTDPRPSPPYTLEENNPDGVGNYLQSCSKVKVTQYILGISSLGEFDQLTGGNSTDPVQNGSLYVYRFEVRAGTGSTGSQTGVRFILTRTAGSSTFTGAPNPTKTIDYEVELSTNGGVTFTTVPLSAITVNASSSTTFDITYDDPLNPLQPGNILRISVRARAAGTTNTDVEAQAFSIQAPNPVSVTETTTIQ